MPLYDFKCKECGNVSPYHLMAKNYDEESSKLTCTECDESDLMRYFGNAKLVFSGMFHEQTVGGVTFGTETAKKAYERENGYIPLSYEENKQETSKNRARIDKADSDKTKSDVREIVKRAYYKNSK